MFTFSIDLGQIVIASMMGIIGYSIKKTIDRIFETLDNHDKLINSLRIELAELRSFLGRVQ